MRLAATRPGWLRLLCSRSCNACMLKQSQTPKFYFISKSAKENPHAFKMIDNRIKKSHLNFSKSAKNFWAITSLDPACSSV